MKKFITLARVLGWPCLFLAFFLFSSPLLAQTRIEWQANSAKFITNGVYARVKKINTGELVMAYSDGPDVHIRKSSNNGASWGNQIFVAHNNGYNCTNAEITQLSNGWLLYSWNGRPLSDGSIPYTIKTKISRDNGATWGDERMAYQGDVTFQNGVWEPVTMQLPSGEVQIYFANESPYRNNADQEISLMRSFDNGLSWGNFKRISFRAGARDGMPVPVYLKNNRGIAFAIEDNGINGAFKPVIIWSSTGDNWNQETASGNSPRRWHALRSDQQLASDVYAGAPYLIQLPSGETVLSCQSSQGRLNADRAIMQVYVGDGDARNFANRSTPFTNIPSEGNAFWNALTVIDDNTVMAVSSIYMGPGGQNGIWTAIGKVVRNNTGGGSIVSGKVYRVVSRMPTANVLDVSSCSTADGAPVQTWRWLGGNCQRWKVEATDNGFYRLISQNSGKALDIAGAGSQGKGSSVLQWPWSGGAWQQWKIEPTDNGYFSIKSRFNMGWGLDINACSDAEGAKVHVWDYWGGACQQWKFEEVPAFARVGEEVDVPVAALQLAPNPAQDQVQLTWEGMEGEAVTLTLVNPLGKPVYQVAVKGNTYTLPTIDLKPGIYVVNLRGEHSQLTQKLAIRW